MAHLDIFQANFSFSVCEIEGVWLVDEGFKTCGRHTLANLCVLGSNELNFSKELTRIFLVNHKVKVICGSGGDI